MTHIPPFTARAARLAFLACMLAVAGCGSSGSQEGFTQPGGMDAGTKPDGAMPPPLGGADAHAGDGMLGGEGGGPQPMCNPMSADQSGCSCPTAGATRACYTGDPKTRNVGSCKDGMQTCMKSGEFATWGACMGAVTPGMESCTGMVDANCNGKVGCADPQCASDPSCNTGCTNGQTRPCYDGPSGTENVGTCKDGTQTCVNGQWPSACTGEVLPAASENCCDALDHNCNGLPGCFDFFSCITAACCQESCSPSQTDPGCVCMNGAGDTATCPQGDHYVHKGPIPGGTDECCPCTANDCGTPNCCGESVCAGSSWCTGMMCNPLPASCNGQVSADCDDFPEDCDEPCCECTQC